MNKNIKLLRTVKVYNDFAFFGSEPYISQRVTQGHRDVYPSGWYVNLRGTDLNKGKGHWHDGDKKFFSYHGRKGREAAHDLAVAFMAQCFGITEFAKSPFGSWGDRAFVERRLAELLAKAGDVPVPRLKLTKKDTEAAINYYDVFVGDKLVGRVEKDSHYRGDYIVRFFHPEGQLLHESKYQTTVADTVEYVLLKNPDLLDG